MGTSQGQPNPAVSDAPGTASVRRGSLVASVGLLLMIAFAMYATFIVLEALVTPGDATQTATAVTDAEGSFRMAIVSLFLVAILDVFVAWGLYLVFEPAAPRLSMLAAWLRVVYAGVFLVAISNLVGVIRLLDSPDYLGGFTSQQIQAQAFGQIETFYEVWNAGLGLFGLHLLVLGYVAYRADYVTNVLAVLIGIAGLGYTIDFLGSVLSAEYTLEISTITFVGEVVLLGWLLLRGRKLELDEGKTSTAD